MFISLLSHGDPFWIAWLALLDVALLSFLYGSGILLIVVDGRYYCATDSKSFTDVTARYFSSPANVQEEGLE